MNKPLMCLYLVLILLGLAIRSYAINIEGFWLDEIMQVSAVKGRNISDVWKNIPPDKPPAVYYELYYLSKICLTETFLRLPSLIANMITMAGVGVIAHLIYGSKKYIVFLSLTIFCISPLNIQLSREILPYAQSNMFLVISFIAILRLLSSSNRRWYFGLFFCTSLSLWSVYQSLPSIAALMTGVFLILVYNPKEEKSLELASAGMMRLLHIYRIILISIFLTFPLWGRFFSGLHTKAPWNAPPMSWKTIMFFGNNLSAGFDGSKTNTIWLLYGFSLIAEIICTIKEKRRNNCWLLLCWLVGGLSFLFLMAGAQDHWIASRYLIFYIPPFIVIVAGGLHTIVSWIPNAVGQRFLRVSLPFLVIVWTLPTVIESFHSRPNIRGLARHLEETAQQGDLVLFQHSYDEYCYNFYREEYFKRAPRSTYYQITFPSKLNAEAKNIIKNASRIWVPELINTAYPIDNSIKSFFTRNNTNSQDDIRYHREDSKNVLDKIDVRHEQAGNGRHHE